MAKHKGITPSDLCEGHLKLIGNRPNFRENFLQHEYIRLLHLIPSDRYAREVELYLTLSKKDYE